MADIKPEVNIDTLKWTELNSDQKVERIHAVAKNILNHISVLLEEVNRLKLHAHSGDKVVVDVTKLPAPTPNVKEDGWF